MNFLSIHKFVTQLILTLSFFVSLSLSAQEINADSEIEFNHLAANQTLGQSFNKKNDTENTDLYQQIADEFNLEYENIGRREAERVLSHNGLSVTGGLNSVGFSYRKPFINFGVTLDRNLAPDLFDDKRWIVTDTFTIDIDASRIFGNLKKEGAIDISDQNLAAFAGIVFKRKFTWIHYADNYNDGLMRDFDKLFFPFKRLDHKSLVDLETNEMIFKEDSISLKAGGMVSAPLYPGISGAAGVLAKFQKLARVEVVSMPGKTSDEHSIQVTSEKTKVAEAGINLSLQADFLKILRLTLLSYDYSYELSSSYKIYLDFKKSQLQNIDSENPLAVEITNVLKNREGKLNILAPYIISEEKKVSTASKHKYNFFLLGGQKSAKTQQVEVAKEGRVKTFFRHYYEKIKYTESALSKIFSSVIFALTNTDMAAQKKAMDTKKVTIEYDSEKNLLDAKEDLNIGEVTSFEQKLSMTFSSEFVTQSTSGSSGKKYRERAKFILERFSGVDPTALDLIEKGHLVAPYNVEGKYQINIDGLRYFNSLETREVFSYIDGLCHEYPSKAFFNFRNLFDNCRKNLQNTYVDYKKDLTHDKVSASDVDYCETEADQKNFSASKTKAFIKKCLSDINKLDESQWVNIPLWSLKNVMNGVVNSSYSKVHFYNLFGVKNVFFFGSFDAVTSDGRAFTTYFHEGAFKGLGAVDHYMRAENLRAPSSVVVDQ